MQLYDSLVLLNLPTPLQTLAEGAQNIFVVSQIDYTIIVIATFYAQCVD